ncbi:YybH family protein [Pyrinomonas methylaliphatogenes]|uniref:Ketosteroid isomerase-like enzyme n=1 Tax=Pyrinomonas methylaliphatogenes TaxID=454194 RepID=A0A0B6WX66_9BACT|nr:nuclear transport factor 2 family protein [Pyrinomonas methylaliphatogenes]CDM65883.1 ketosteroid isomerase-like enzyme [Pyrinomonas methylaliphatogenes]
MDTNAEKSDIERVIRSWERAIQRGDMEGILANHSESVLMFDVPEPLQSEGLDAYRKTWELFFRYGAPDREVFVLEDLRITAGDTVAFATALLRIGGSSEPVCRLTLGLMKRNRAWQIVHEHHSAPHKLNSEVSQ